MTINQFTIKGAKEGLKNKEFSCVELTKACLEQIKKHNPRLNAFITVCEEKALAEAKRADKLLLSSQPGVHDLQPLLGIPIALKDLFLTKNIKTTAASKVLENYVPQYDATVVKKLKDAGAVIIGKTNCDAWAHGSSGENSDFGPTLNPYNIEYVPGGSSSGSAVCVASDMCLASTGTDTGGSIRLPASFCNVVGLKPTYGRVSRYGIVAMASSLDSIGHFTKTVEDNALMLSVTAGHDPMDATTPNKEVPDYTKNLKKGIKGLKIGSVRKYLNGLDPKINEAIEQTEKILTSLGATVENIASPFRDAVIAAYYIIQPSEVSSNLARYDGIRYGNSRKLFGDEAKRRIMLGTYTLSAGYYDAYYKKAMKTRTAIINDLNNYFFKLKYDAIITPVSPTPPWPLGDKIDDPLKMYLSDIFTVSANLAGVPGLSLPIGFTANKLPIGMQILGPQFSEELLFQIGYSYEQETKWYKYKPSL